MVKRLSSHFIFELPMPLDDSNLSMISYCWLSGIARVDRLSPLVKIAVSVDQVIAVAAIYKLTT